MWINRPATTKYAKRVINSTSIYRKIVISGTNISLRFHHIAKESTEDEDSKHKAYPHTHKQPITIGDLCLIRNYASGT